MSAYTEHDMHKQAQATLERMTAAGVQPNEVTVVCLLNATSHAGLGQGMRHLYDQLQIRFPDLKLNASHRSCVVDGFSRARLFDEAAAEAYALEYNVAWMSILGAVRIHGRLDIGELALKKLRRLGIDKADLASAHLMSHVFPLTAVTSRQLRCAAASEAAQAAWRVVH